jgi:hypothetical protein
VVESTETETFVKILVDKIHKAEGLLSTATKKQELSEAMLADL